MRTRVLATVSAYRRSSGFITGWKNRCGTYQAQGLFSLGIAFGFTREGSERSA